MEPEGCSTCSVVFSAGKCMGHFSCVRVLTLPGSVWWCYQEHIACHEPDCQVQLSVVLWTSLEGCLQILILYFWLLMCQLVFAGWRWHCHYYLLLNLCYWANLGVSDAGGRPVQVNPSHTHFQNPYDILNSASFKEAIPQRIFCLSVPMCGVCSSFWHILFLYGSECSRHIWPSHISLSFNMLWKQYCPA
jgi:hypothetical protein